MADALLFFRVQNLVDEKFRGILWFVMKMSHSEYLYTKRNHIQRKVVWIVLNCS